jgi:predicted site-specific integrase-resolvase
MNDRLIKPKDLSRLFGVTPQTLAQWEADGKLQAARTTGGHRRYVYPHALQPQRSSEERKKYIYARVSSFKQQQDLQRQIALLQSAYPDFDVIQDVGSGINFKRRGFLTLLDNVIGGNVSHVVVAHRDRLTRFGFDMLQHIFDRFEVSLEVLSDDDVKEPARELAKDLLSIVTVFAARYHGSRKYQVLPKDQVLSEPRAEGPHEQVCRGCEVLLQQGSKHPQGKRRQGTLVKVSAAPSRDAKRR